MLRYFNYSIDIEDRKDYCPVRSTNLDKEKTHWTIHVSAVFYIIPLIIGWFLFGARPIVFWCIAIAVSLLVLMLIYGFHARYRGLGRLYLLYGIVMVVVGIVLLYLHVNTTLWPDIPMYFMWSAILLIFSYLGALPLTPSSTQLWLNSQFTVYPSSILPQEIHEEGIGSISEQSDDNTD